MHKTARRPAPALLALSLATLATVAGCSSRCGGTPSRPSATDGGKGAFSTGDGGGAALPTDGGSELPSRFSVVAWVEEPADHAPYLETAALDLAPSGVWFSAGGVFGRESGRGIALQHLAVGPVVEGFLTGKSPMSLDYFRDASVVGDGTSVWMTPLPPGGDSSRTISTSEFVATSAGKAPRPVMVGALYSSIATWKMGANAVTVGLRSEPTQDLLPKKGSIRLEVLAGVAALPKIPSDFCPTRLLARNEALFAIGANCMDWSALDAWPGEGGPAFLRMTSEGQKRVDLPPVYEKLRIVDAVATADGGLDVLLAPLRPEPKTLKSVLLHWDPTGTFKEIDAPLDHVEAFSLAVAPSGTRFVGVRVVTATTQEEGRLITLHSAGAATSERLPDLRDRMRNGLALYEDDTALLRESTKVEGGNFVPVRIVAKADDDLWLLVRRYGHEDGAILRTGGESGSTRGAASSLSIDDAVVDRAKTVLRSHPAGTEKGCARAYLAIAGVETKRVRAAIAEPRVVVGTGFDDGTEKVLVAFPKEFEGKRDEVAKAFPANQVSRVCGIPVIERMEE